MDNLRDQHPLSHAPSMTKNRRHIQQSIQKSTKKLHKVLSLTMRMMDDEDVRHLPQTHMHAVMSHSSAQLHINVLRAVHLLTRLHLSKDSIS